MEEWLIVIPLVIIIVLTLIQVFARYVLLSGILWSDEAVGYLFVLMAMIGAAVALRERMHTDLQLLVNKAPRWLAWIMRLLAGFTVGGFLIMLLISGLDFAYENRGQVSPMLGLPMFIAYGLLPLGAILMLVEFGRLIFARSCGSEPAESERIFVE
ncbi:TRAP transporter small permease [Gelria sp. Kuro-4]|uniref:TRAP transporter small permease n=1 Tax=Gelria sp. Kuro-4 TaxID=2796927 RepID=UPI001C80BBC9|nr:TRAP transporter small permease [Gelria sp. Kuro-4]